MILNFRKGLDKETEDKMNDVITFEIRLLLMPISKIIAPLILISVLKKS